jgi:hypothetical protein
MIFLILFKNFSPMNSIKVLFVVSILGCLYSPVYSRQDGPSIHFENESHNFGTIREEDGNIKHDFVFTNKGDTPLIVTDVRVSGGVAVTGWTTKPVMPGEYGIVSLEYDPANKPGRFNRSIVIASTGRPATLMLRLLGEVIPRGKTPEELYPGEIGRLRLKTTHVSFGNVTRGSVRKDSIQVINLSGETIDLSFLYIPGHISPAAVPSKLEPGEKGLFFITYDAARINDWGFVTDNFRVSIDGSSPGNSMIYVSANIQEDFSRLSEEDKEKAAGISFVDRVFDFGKLKHGATVEHDFVFSNTGRSDLVIRSVRSGCGCTATDRKRLS